MGVSNYSAWVEILKLRRPRRGGGGGKNDSPTHTQKKKPNIPIPSARALNLLPLIINHAAAAAHVVWPAEAADLGLPHVLLAHEPVDLVVEVADLEVAQAGFLDLGHLARYLLEHLAPPFLAHGDRGDGGDGLGAASARDVEDPQRGGLLRSEAEEHGLRFFGVASLWVEMGLGRGGEGGGGRRELERDWKGTNHCCSLNERMG